MIGFYGIGDTRDWDVVARRLFNIEEGARVVVPFPLPNMERMKPAQFWFKFHSIAPPSAISWLVTRKKGDGYALPIVFFVGEGYLHNGGYAVENVTRTTRRHAHTNYYQWSLCNKGFTQSKLSTHEHKVTCNACGYSFAMES